MDQVDAQNLEQAISIDQESEPVENSEPSVVWKTYSNEALNFQMDYPGDWTLEDRGLTKESRGLDFLTSLNPYEDGCLKQDVAAIQFQHHEMEVTSRDEFINQLIEDSVEAQSPTTGGRPSWGGYITQDLIQSLRTNEAKEILKVAYDYEPWSRKALCIGEIPPEVIYFVPYKDDWSEFFLILVVNDPDPFVEQAILTLRW